MKHLRDMNSTELFQMLADVPDLRLMALIVAAEQELTIRKVDDRTRAQILAMRLPGDVRH